MKNLSVIASLFLITACSSSDNDSKDEEKTQTPESYSYEITLTNLTNAQPISPPVAILHGDDFSAWELGGTASESLEYLAEGGDTAQLVEDAADRPHSVAEGALASGQTAILNVSTQDRSHTLLTLAGMLVNTNDAFTGVAGYHVDQLAVDQSVSMPLHAYDAGTEANSESVNTIPGPAAGGEGFAAERDDATPLITRHGGVVSRDDGYPESALTEAHRFDGPVMHFTIKRLK